VTDLPSTWIAVKIVDVLTPTENGKPFQQGWSPQCEKISSKETQWGVLKTTAIQEGVFLQEANKKLPESLQPRPHLEVRQGDILMTCAGPRARCGVTCFVKKTRNKLMISGKMYRFRSDNQKILPNYL
jgi:type I restriction enzyme S subunit